MKFCNVVLCPTLWVMHIKIYQSNQHIKWSIHWANLYGQVTGSGYQRWWPWTYRIKKDIMKKLQSLAWDDVMGPTKNRSRLDNLCGSHVKEVTKQSFSSEIMIKVWNCLSANNAVNFFILKNEYLINVDKKMEDYSPSKIISRFAEMLQTNVPKEMF